MSEKYRRTDAVTFFVNPVARPATIEFAKQVAKDHPNVEVVTLNHTLPKLKDGGIKVPVGGDGTVWKVASQMMELDDPGVLATLPAGSNNGFDLSVRREAGSLSVAQIRKSESDELLQFQPGMVHSEESSQPVYFFHAISSSPYAIGQTLLTEKWRGKVPRILKSYLGAVEAYFSGLKTGELGKNLHLVMTGPGFGKFNINPAQRLKETTLSHLVIQMDQFVGRMAVLFALLSFRNIPIPESIARITSTALLSVDTPGQTILAPDGELTTLQETNRVTYSRSPRSLPVTAIRL
jgi:hypothetical protein